MAGAMMISRIRLLRGAFAVPFLFVLLAPAPARAGSALTLWTQPLGARFVLAGPTTVRGESPLPLGSEHQGDYRVRASLAGHETAYGKLSLRLQDGSLRLGKAGDFRRERVLSSLALPGLGQLREGRIVEGVFWVGTGLGAGITSLVLEARYAEAHDGYAARETALAGAASALRAGSLSAGAYRTAVHATYRAEALASRRLRERNYALGALAVVWGLNLADASFLHSSFDVKEGSGGMLQVALAEKTRSRAVLRSIVCPGFGQYYEGRRLRGAVYTAGATAAAVAALVAHLEYKGHLDQVDALDREMAALTPGGPAEADFSRVVAAERETAFRRSEDNRDRRDLAVFTTAAVYAASILDAALSGRASRPAEKAPKLGIAAPVSDGLFGIGVRVAF
jgi:hypothetical protein